MNRTLLAFAALTTTLAMSVAHATDGTINFTGELTAQTCTARVNGSTTAVSTVALPRIATTSLATAGATGGATTFTIALTGCSTGANVIASAAAFFEAGPGVDPTTRNLRSTGTANNVQLQLLDSDGEIIQAGAATQVANTARTTVTAGAATLPYSVRYVATGVPTAGTVVSSVTYSLNYQ
ncbi:fimbrial protein [Pseudomonas fluorescens]|uniref:Fimbrial protein n=1 Tax=Pseudomonas fluorescens TaxID=294 RepID=A0A1T2Y200_PSEFL|nr:fimbrial protein [Pseudomonas fluorescens]OPA86082.1 fimbrial protein [Pseudomonas fluorescens]